MRNQNTTKWDYGHALLIAGAYGRMGCAILAARAAMRSGLGLLTVHLPLRCVDAMQAAFPEAMISTDTDEYRFSTPPSGMNYYSSIGIGPGIGTSVASAKALFSVLKNRPKEAALVLDADALNILSEHKEWLTYANGAIITPHEREYRRLFGEADSREMAQRYGLIIVKKSHRTEIYSSEGEVFVNQTGNAAMATAGSGDVLLGILLGMLSSNMLNEKRWNIVCSAVEIHGKTADLAIKKQSESSVIASDLVENLKFLSTDIQ